MIQAIITATINAILVMIATYIILTIGVKFFADSIIFYFVTIIALLLMAIFYKIANAIYNKMTKIFEDYRLS